MGESLQLQLGTGHWAPVVVGCWVRSQTVYRVLGRYWVRIPDLDLVRRTRYGMGALETGPVRTTEYQSLLLAKATCNLGPDRPRLATPSVFCRDRLL